MLRKIRNSIYFYFCLLLALTNTAKSQERDTVLNTMLSNPYFYNIIQLDQNKVYAGTSDGIFELSKNDLRQIDTKPGYITGNTDGKPVIDSTGILFYAEKKYIHLLPFPELSRDEFHATLDNKFYICSGGKLYIYDLVPFRYSYPYHSIRSISKDLVGSYSGIYLRGKKLTAPIPGFTDGYIRQFDDRAFICNYEIVVLEKDAVETGQLNEGKNYFIHTFSSMFLVNDIRQHPTLKFYLVATENNLIQIDRNFNKDSILFSHKYQKAPVVFINGDKFGFYFTANNELYQYIYNGGKIVKTCSLTDRILGGVFTNQQIYLVTNKGLYRYNSNLEIEKLANINTAHSILSISGSELLISSDNGLYLYNISNKTLSIVIKGVEFNRQALHTEGDTIYAGALNGLYTFTTKDIQPMVVANKAELKQKSDSNNIYVIIIIISLIIAGAIIIVRSYSKKLKTAVAKIETLQTPKESISREKIEAYINNNLPTASIKTLMDHFKVSAPIIYEALKPDRPGSIIQQLRLKTVIEMRQQNKAIEEIAEVTGLSISYLKKIK